MKETTKAEILKVCEKLSYPVSREDLERALATGQPLYCEECDCGDRIRHNNGGNYHKVVNLRRFDNIECYGFAVIEMSTRESFLNDKYEMVFISSDGKINSVDDDDDDDTPVDFYINITLDRIAAVIVDTVKQW